MSRRGEGPGAGRAARAARALPLVALLAGLGGPQACFVESSGSRTGRGGDRTLEPDADRAADAEGAGGADARADTDLAADAEQVGDAEAVCQPTDERCVGNVRWTCRDGAVESEDCGASAHCDETADGPLCVANLCVPRSTTCSDDGTAMVVCDERGASSSTVPCSRGCAEDACRPQTPCTEDVHATTSGGTFRVNLCDAGADQDHTSACGWPEQSPAGEDVMFRLEVDRPRRIRIQARQVASDGVVDPTVYLRSVCEERESELWCREDTAGQDEDFEVDFVAGDFFLVVDRHERATTRCGELDVTITPL